MITLNTHDNFIKSDYLIKNILLYPKKKKIRRYVINGHLPIAVQCVLLLLCYVSIMNVLILI